MSKIIEAINNRKRVLKGVAVGTEVICEAEKTLNLTFNDEYKEYLLNFGVIAYSGHELTGITKSERVNVVCVTKEEWLNNEFCSGMYVIEQANIDNIVIWQSTDGAIYRSVGSNRPQKIFDSLSDYIAIV